MPLRRARIYLAALCASLGALLVAYSQTKAFAWDEGFHVLIAQLITRGQRPYIDFVFSQTPLNACWNAFWLAIAGGTWHTPHAAAAVCSAAAVLLTATFLLTRFPQPEWRFPAAVLVALMTGLNVLVVRYGGIAQAYGFCLLALTTAWRFAIRTVEQRSTPAAALTGFACGIAAGSSLLTLPASPVLLIWIFIYSDATSRYRRATAFLAGAATAFIPVLYLFAQSPSRVWFGIVEYNMKYRQLDWPDAARQNFEVLISWIDSGDALLLITLASAGLLIVMRNNARRTEKAPYYLCAWLALAFALHISTARPTFERYYIFTVPFLAILSIPAIVAIARNQRTAACVIVTLLTSVALLRSLYNERDAMSWTDIEKVAAKVASVTDPNQTLFADEAVYFLTAHQPPSGMEMRDSHKFTFPNDKSAYLHLIPWATLDEKVHAGYFATLETCEDSDYIQKHGYGVAYRDKAEVGECTVFWNRK